MVFEKAKQIITTETQKEGIVLDEKAKLEVKKTKNNLNKYKKITENYIDKLTYQGKDQDKSRYIRKLWAALRDVLKDKKGSKEEMEKVRKNLNTRSENLKERIIQQQRAHEQLEFRAVKELNSENMLKADFNTSIKRLEDFKKSLSPLNKTNNSGNIEEHDLRLDMKAQEQIDSLKNLKKLYKAKYQKGTAFLNGKESYYVHSSKNGIVEFSPFEYKKKNVWSKPKLEKRQKMNWVQFQKMTEKAGCKIKKYKDNQYEDFDVDADKEVVKSRAKIEEIKRLKEINYIFSEKILDSIKDPKQKELIKKGIEEHYNSMRLYFEKDSKGVVRPTEVYNSLTVGNRVKALMKMISGVNAVIGKIKLKETLENEKDPLKKMFYKAELAFKNGDTMQAYAHFRAFKKKTDLWGYRNYQAQFSKLAKNWDLPGAIKIAEKRLRRISFKLINTSEKYVTAAIQQKASGVFISAEVAKKTHKELRQVLNGMRKALQSGDAYDVTTAWQKVGLPWYRARQDRMKGLKFSELGRSETQLRVFHMPMIIKLTEIALITNKAEQKKKLLTLADDARKTKFRGAASILYKEYMQDDLQKFEKEKMKTKDYWKEKRKTYMAIKNSDNPIVAEYRNEAKEIAMKTLGKEKFSQLTDKQKKDLTAKYEHMLLENEVNKGATKGLFKSFLKKAEGSNKAAAKYVDMKDPFDEWFKLSDEGADTVKELAGEAAILACSGGIGNLAGRGATAGLRMLAKKTAEKLVVRLATAGVGIAVDMVVSEIIDRSIRTVLMGQKGLFSKKELMNALKHSIATYGVLSLGTRMSGVVMRKLENAGQLARYAARVGQVVAVEAPLMATLNQQFAGGEGKWLDHYGQSMMTILASRAGMKLLHGATNNMLLKAEHAMEFKARLHSLKARNPAKGALIEGILESGNLPKESVVQLMDANLSVTEMKNLSKYMNEPKNGGFLLAIKYAEENGTMTKKMQQQYKEQLLDLRLMGFSKSQASKFAKSLSLQGLLNKYGEGAKKIAKDQLDSAVSALRKSEAKEWLNTNSDKVKSWLKKPNIKEAFVAFMEKTQGNYAKFLKKYPKLAKIMPKDLTKLKVIPVPQMAAFLGADFKSVADLAGGRPRAFEKHGQNLDPQIYAEGKLTKEMIQKSTQPILDALNKVPGMEKPIKIIWDNKMNNVMHIKFQNASGKEVALITWEISKKGSPAMKGGYIRIPEDMNLRGLGIGRKIYKAQLDMAEGMGFRGKEIMLDNVGFWSKMMAEDSGKSAAEVKTIIEEVKNGTRTSAQIGPWKYIKGDTWRYEFKKTNPEFNKLAAKLEAVGLKNMAELIRDPKNKFMTDNGNKIETLEQRGKEVARLLKMDSELKMETDFLRDCGLEKQAKNLENYNDSSNLDLKARLDKAKKLSDEMEKLQNAGLLRGNLNGEQVLDLIHFKSAEGQKLKTLVINHQLASQSGNQNLIRSSFEKLRTTLNKHFPNISAKVVMSVSDLTSGPLIGESKFNLKEFESFCGKSKKNMEFLTQLKGQLGNNSLSINHDSLTKLSNTDVDVKGELTPAQKLKIYLGIKTRESLLKSSDLHPEQKASQLQSLKFFKNLFIDGNISKDISYKMIEIAMKSKPEQIIPKLNVFRTMAADVKILEKQGLHDCVSEVMDLKNQISRVDGSPLGTLEQRMAYIEKLKNLSPLELKWYKNRPPKLPYEGHPDHYKIAYALKNYTANFISKELIPHLAKQKNISYESLLQQIHSWQTKGSKAQLDVLTNPEEGYNISGRYREMPVIVGNYEAPHNIFVPELMKTFDRQLNNFSTQLERMKNKMTPSEYELSAIQLAAHAQQRFVDIHPMRDGNGRTSRALYEFMIVKLLGPNSKYKKIPMGVHADNGEPTLHSALTDFNAYFQKRNYPDATYTNEPYQLRNWLENETLNNMLSDNDSQAFAYTIKDLVDNPRP